jgi:hypothetical protein
MRILARGSGVFLAALLLAASAVTPAYADTSDSTTWGSFSYKSSTNTLTLKDTQCNSHPVYVRVGWVYNSGQDPSSWTEVDNKGGCGSTLTKPLSVQNRYFVGKLCQDDFPPDTCRAWKWSTA